jgi:hypothetical protein
MTYAKYNQPMKTVLTTRPESMSEEDCERLTALELEKTSTWLFERTFGFPKSEFEVAILQEIQEKLGS